MAALSCYQPCRSHLAQPARCLNDEDFAEPLTLRRRQFIERCHESRGYRYRDPVVPVEVSVKKTRDELTKNASQAAQLNRRLHIESGWSKVEEVRKKFEGAAVTCSGSFSRSFESPPRRRLADSLFASLKLRRKEGMAAPRSAAPAPKRKSAVELLAETKAFYVKSETVRDRKQELPLRVSSGLSQAIAVGGCHLVSSGTLNNDACCNTYGAGLGAGGRGVARRGAGGGAEAERGLQGTLRRLLEHNDSRENVYSPTVYMTHKPYSNLRRNQQTTLSGTSSSGTSGSKVHSRSEPTRSVGRPRSFGEGRVFFPDSFVVTHRPSERAVSKHSLPSPASSPESPHDAMSADIGAISPPAQYAHSAPRYIRSNSHSQPSARVEEDSPNINSHKSLPDLHMQTRCYPEHVQVGTETIGRSPRRRRHSTHQRTASCSSKGTRSNHSSVMSSCDAFSEHPSPGEENYPYNSQCGSFARDSGGSSGHYTQRSAPPQRTTDSGSSIQHENSSRQLSYSACVGHYVSAPPQFQDGAPSPPAPPEPVLYCPTVQIHFQASAPPPQFQDDPPVYYDKYDSCKYKKPVKIISAGRKDYGIKDFTRYYQDPMTDLITQQPIYAEIRPRRPKPDDTQEYVNTTQICPGPEEITSPLGTFKRQRCLRYKQRKPRPILRSKSDISDRYRRPEGRNLSAPGDSPSPDSSSSDSRLHHFFTRLGLESRQYDALVSTQLDETPVYFSSCSSVDSNQLPDYTVQGPTPQKPIYRNTEPPSVVERNARIVKWLCQCRKTQMQPN